MTCRIHENCTRFRTWNIHGEEGARRLLKAWALRGAGKRDDGTLFDKEDHKAQWRRVMKDFDKGTLPKEEELDWQMGRWPDHCHACKHPFAVLEATAVPATQAAAASSSRSES